MSTPSAEHPAAGVPVTRSGAGARVCIHQPTYLPWLGFFHKLSISDTWIVLDDCQLTRQSWISRVHVKGANGRVLLSVPVRYRFGDQAPLRDIRIDDSHGWRRKHEATLRQAYGRSPHFAAIEPLLEITFGRRHEFLADLDLAGIEWLGATLGVAPRRCASTTLGLAHLTGSERLAALTRAVGGDTYVSGRGSDEYLEPGVFAAAGVALEYQDFVAMPYPQAGGGEFLPGLSALDAIASVGVEAAAALARNAAAGAAAGRERAGAD